MPSAPIAVDWEVASDERFAKIARSGTVYATPDWAHSVHVEATGLEPARDYWYRFTSGGARSATGRARTAPAAGAQLARFRLAVANCQYYEYGHYAAYRAIAASELDLVVHVGDYIYEQRGVARVRSHDAPECFTLDDYRHRHSLYKLDPDLQAAHAAFAWMFCSDDHEVSNDYASDHPIDGEPAEVFLPRRAAAYQAYYEHLPLPRRMLPRGRGNSCTRSATSADLVNLYMLDGRQYRSYQACGSSALVKPCAELYEPQRTMLGAAQEKWLEGTLGGEPCALERARPTDSDGAFQPERRARRALLVRRLERLPAARARLIDCLAERRIANPVVLSGDIHAFLVNDLNRRQTTRRRRSWPPSSSRPRSARPRGRSATSIVG
jgi:alkaline phosphatase D